MELLLFRCMVLEGKRDCHCLPGFIGDGRHGCRVPKRDCHDLLVYHNITQSGIYGGNLGIWAGMELNRTVRCDMDTADGKWHVHC